MTDSVTILLTTSDPVLTDGIARLRPDVRVIAPGSQGQLERVVGPLWGFIDWILPELSGLELCRRLREAENTHDAHLTMVLEGADADARRRALAAGADDYMIGPLTPEGLLARIDAVHPEHGRHGVGQRLRHGEITLDLTAFQARFRGAVLPLRPNEFRLLAHFVENPDQVFTRASLIDRLGKDSEEIDERTVDVWIGRLRRGLRAQGVPDPLRTVRSLGYVMDSLPV
ncbi:MAG: response regulator [Sphingomonadales bacterium]|nr:response regulator [Sphingomonadales bacterium]MBU3993094.1 response regulator transcription factor [Alphaproteobacteria bacterium]